MKYRHELKHEISLHDKLVLRQRLSAIMKVDKHTMDGRYSIRSLYFDSPDDKALWEKKDGVDVREKFRIRYYNGDISTIVLEKKSKINGLCGKQQCFISKAEAQSIVDGDIEWMKTCGNRLCAELYFKMKTQLLKPKTIVDYNREAYVYAPGNVRITFDDNIRTSINKTDFLSPNTVMVPIAQPVIVLEVKWDEMLPEVIKAAVALDNRRCSAYSKYEQCRIYG